MKKIMMLIVVLIAIGCGAVAYADETGSSSSNSNNTINQTNNNNNTTSINQANGGTISTNSSNEINSNNGNNTNSNISQSNNKSISNITQNNNSSSNSNEDNSYHIVNAPNYVYLSSFPIIAPDGPYIKEEITVGSKVKVLKDNTSKIFDKIEYNGQVGYVPGIFVGTHTNPQILNKVIGEENEIKQQLRSTGSYVPSQFIEPLYIHGTLCRGALGPQSPFALVNGFYVNKQDPYGGDKVLQIVDSADGVNANLLGIVYWPIGNGIFEVNGKTGYSQNLNFYYNNPEYGKNY